MRSNLWIRDPIEAGSADPAGAFSFTTGESEASDLQQKIVVVVPFMKVTFLETLCHICFRACANHAVCTPTLGRGERTSVLKCWGCLVPNMRHLGKVVAVDSPRVPLSSWPALMQIP